MHSKIISTALFALAVLGAANSGAAAERYKAELSPLNADKIGASPAGEATFEIDGDVLEVTITMHSTPASIEHWEHFHGFPDSKDADCVTAAADSNGDGYVDLGETGPVSGTTMVPFNDEPEKMDIPTHTYPRADASGKYEYTKRVPLKALEAQFGKTFDGKSIDLDKRVLYVHGVPEGHGLPESVRSLGPIPSHVTLPIACGKIVKVN